MSTPNLQGADATEWVSTDTPDANGNAIIVVPPVPIGTVWVIEQITVFASSTTVTTAAVFKNGLFWAGTVSGNFDVATGLPYLRMGPGDTVQIQWSGCSALDASGATTLCTATVFYELAR